MSYDDQITRDRPLTPLPAFAVPQRAVAVFDYIERGETISERETGWAKLDAANQWLHFLPDHSPETWQSWPPYAVLTVEWGAEA